MAGNYTLVRHASIVPQCAERFANLLQKEPVLQRGFYKSADSPEFHGNVNRTQAVPWCVI